jgi:glycosyltransferase involved in cell wall biosynthesis
LRILELTDLYPPFIGGLERHVELLSRELASQGHEVVVATSYIPGTPSPEEADGVTVHRLAGWQRVLSPFYAADGRPFHPTLPDPGMVRALREVIERHQPDVVHSHSWNVLSYLPLHRKGEGRALIHTAHDYGQVCAKKTMTLTDGSVCSGPSLRKCLGCARSHYGTVKGFGLAGGLFASSRLLRRVDRFLAVSQFVADRLAETITPITGKPVEAVPSFVPAGLFDAAASAARPEFLPPEDGYLLFVGALSAHKGLHLLLDAHRRLQRRVPLVLIGTPQPDTPVDLPDDVIMVTNVGHAQVMAAMRRASMVVAPSLWPDPLPMTVSEAQLCGVPVIGSRSGGIPEQIADQCSGLIVPPGDVVALASAIDELLADPNRRAQMGAAGRVHAARFEVPAVAATLTEIFQETLKEVRSHVG